MEKRKVGFTIGKFAPLHKGHQYLIETALKEMDHMIVIVYDTHLTNISTELRANWIKTLYPKVEVKIAKDPPSQYGLDEESVKIQMEYLNKIIQDIPVTHFYSSEPYGKCVADYLKIIDRRIDTKRKNIQISSDVIRDDLENNKKWLDELVYEEWKKFNK